MHLNTHSYFSLRYGTMSVPDLLEEARSKGLTTLALTDINNTSGCIDFIRMAPEYGIRPAVGIDLRNGNRMMYVAVARNNDGFTEINRFLSKHLKSGEPLPDRVPAFLNSFVIYPFGSIHPNELRENEFIGIAPHEENKLLFSDVRHHKNKLVALSTANVRNQRDYNVHRLLRAIDKNVVLTRLDKAEQGRSDEILYSEIELHEKYPRYPFLVDNAKAILDQCSIHFEYGKSKNKKKYNRSAWTDSEMLRSLAEEGLRYRYDVITEELTQRLDKELALIEKQGFSAYFLINWDIVRYAASQNFFYVGRGSGANSLVAYCLRITDVDPVGLDLYFERFMNEFRVNPPDFDIDFSWKDRDAVTDYIFRRHGEEHTALLATYSTFQASAVIRELGKVFGLPKAEIDALVAGRRFPMQDDHITKLISRYSQYIHDFPNHLSIHAGGVLISEEPIYAYSATSLPPKGFPTTQFSMLEAEDIGLYKFDILSQRGLGHIKDTVEIVKRNKNETIDIRDVKRFFIDDKVRSLLKNGKTIGCFYVESPAMRMLLKKLKAETYRALVAASSIIRPGVAQSGMMKAYIERFQDPSKCEYIHPKMKELMEETFGIMVYQEDVIKVAHYFAGMTLAEADVLRRGMSGKFRARDEFQKAENNFIEGCRRQGYPDEITFEVWRQVKSFAGYSFSKGHSASYAVESYQSMFLKAYYPLEFIVGVINNFGGFYSTEYYVHEARMEGAAICAPCVNHSEYVTNIYGSDIYLGFIHMNGFEVKTAEAIVEERNKNGKYKSLEELTKRVSISLEMLTLLIRIGALRFTGRTKKQLMWDMYAIMGHAKKTKPVVELFEAPKRSYTLPDLHYEDLDNAIDEIEILGFPLCSPFDLITEMPSNIMVSDLHKYTGKRVSVVGYFVCTKHTRTIKGDEMMFGTFLDKEGYFLDTTHFPQATKSFPFRGKGCYLVTGKVAEEFGVYSIEVDEMVKLGVKK